MDLVPSLYNSHLSSSRLDAISKLKNPLPLSTTASSASSSSTSSSAAASSRRRNLRRRVAQPSTFVLVPSVAAEISPEKPPASNGTTATSTASAAGPASSSSPPPMYQNFEQIWSNKSSHTYPEMQSRLLLPSLPRQPMLIIDPAVPSPSPSASLSSSIGASLAIVVVIIIAVVTFTCILILLRRSQHRRLSWSSFSPRCSFSPSAVSSSSTESSMSREAAAAAAAGASPWTNSDTSLVEMAAVSSASKAASELPSAASAAESVMASESVVVTEAAASTVPSAPALPEVERVILELLSQPPWPAKPGGSKACFICNGELVPTDELLLPVCRHTFHQSCIVTWLRSATLSCCPSCHAPITVPVPDPACPAPTYCPDEYDIEAQMLVPVPPGEEVAEAVGSSRGWLRTSLDALSARWSGCSSTHATAAVLPVSSRRTTGSSSGRLGEDSWSSGWDLEAAAPAPERPTGFNYLRWLFRN